MAKGGDRFALPIDVALPERGRFGFTQAGQPEKLNKIRALLRIVSIVLLRTDGFDDRFELFKARCGTNRFWQLRSYVGVLRVMARSRHRVTRARKCV